MRNDMQVNLLTLRKTSSWKAAKYQLHCMMSSKEKKKTVKFNESCVVSQVSPAMNGNLRFWNFNLQDFEHEE